MKFIYTIYPYHTVRTSWEVLSVVKKLTRNCFIFVDMLLNIFKICKFLLHINTLKFILNCKFNFQKDYNVLLIYKNKTNQLDLQ